MRKRSNGKVKKGRLVNALYYDTHTLFSEFMLDEE